MKVWLDECVDPAFATRFKRHTAVGVVAAGLSSITNGELLRKAETEFEAFVTVDKGVIYQQNIASLKLIFVLLRVGSNRVDVLSRFADEIDDLLDAGRPGSFYIVESHPE